MSELRAMLRAWRRVSLAAGLCFALVSAFACPAAAEARTKAAAARAGVERVLQVLHDIDTTLVDSRYSHVTHVNPKLGLYEFDCSGMASWVLRRAAPVAWQAVRARSSTGRLVARDFFRTIAATSAGRPSAGWERVARVQDAQPGDVIAWLKPASFRSDITGHVGFVMERPMPSQRIAGAYLLRFADASRYRHQDDTRTETGRDGFGSGTILFITDPENGAPAGYGWFGDESAWIAETEIVIGRPRR